MASYQTHMPASARADQSHKHNFSAEYRHTEVECSMCGDVGLREQLLRCKAKGCHRHQHTYCSNWYPEERSEYAGLCNWCAADMAATAIASPRTSSTPAAPPASTHGAASTPSYTSAHVKSKGSAAAATATTSSKSTSSNSSAGTRAAAGRTRYKLVSEM